MDVSDAQSLKTPEDENGMRFCTPSMNSQRCHAPDTVVLFMKGSTAFPDERYHDFVRK